MASELRVQLLGGGAILREVEAAAAMLESDYERSGGCLEPDQRQRIAARGQGGAALEPVASRGDGQGALCHAHAAAGRGPVVAATDYVKLYADQIREFVPGNYTVLGTDGFGRSDTRSKLREFFEVSRNYIVIAALKALADEGRLERSRVTARHQCAGRGPGQAQSADGVRNKA